MGEETLFSVLGELLGRVDEKVEKTRLLLGSRLTGFSSPVISRKACFRNSIYRVHSKKWLILIGQTGVKPRSTVEPFNVIQTR